jgi:phosphoserine phosphatase
MIVISDMMGTLTTGSPILGVLDWVKHNQSKAQARWLRASMTPGYLLAKYGLIDFQVWGQKRMVESLEWLDDMTPEKFDQVAEWVVEHNLWPRRRADVIARLSEHAQAGAQVFIASSIFEPFAACFARRFGVQAIGTPVRIENGRVRMAADLVASERKIQEVLARLNVERVEYAYGDTAMDIPLLEHAEHPVAVYPNQELQRAAQERGWEVFYNL